MQFPVLPTQQDTGCRARRTERKDTLLRPGDTSPTGRHETLPAAWSRHAISFMLRGARGIYVPSVHCHACRSQPQSVQLRKIYNHTVEWTRVIETERG
jgi:hypothetical protein